LQGTPIFGDADFFILFLLENNDHMAKFEERCCGKQALKHDGASSSV